ncbi:MAG TPA: response regulator [Verrucomicrobiae bacterium]|nr:response regulator [Verrucomicrobiae bacterium]
MPMPVTPPAPTTTIYIVDDDAPFLRSVSRLLRAVGYAVETFMSAQEFLDRLNPAMCGCVVSDLQMPELDGMELQAALSRTANPLPVIFLTGQGDIPTSVKAIQGGAVDFLMKIAPKEKLLEAVERALERNRSEQETRARQRNLSGLFSELSEREMEVLGHVVRGRMNKEIAADLDINLRTVKLHRTNITRKLKVQSVAELTRLADEAGLFRPAKK